MNTSTALQSNAVREKLNELDAEIERFRSENAALSRVRVERDEVGVCFAGRFDHRRIETCIR